MSQNTLTPSRMTPPPAAPVTLTSYGSVEQMYKLAVTLSESDIIPLRYQGKPGNVLIALDVASRMGMNPLMVMQNIYVVHGSPGISGQFAIALLNRSSKYRRIEFQLLDPNKGWEAGMRVVGHRKDDPNDKFPDIGTAVTPEMVKGEKWDADKFDKQGNRILSKWKTLGEQMMRYRAASLFTRVYCPELMMGMLTADELEDIHAQEQAMRNVTPAPALFGEQQEAAPQQQAPQAELPQPVEKTATTFTPNFARKAQEVDGVLVESKGSAPANFSENVPPAAPETREKVSLFSEGELDDGTPEFGKAYPRD